MTAFDHKMRLLDLDGKIQEAEREMKDILDQLNLDRIDSLNDIRDARLRARYDRLQLKVKDLKRKKKGGYRYNSGRKSKYEGYETCVIRVPKIFREEIERFIEQKMAQCGCEKHLTEYEKKKEEERVEKRRQEEERNWAFWHKRIQGLMDDTASEEEPSALTDEVHEP